MYYILIRLWTAVAFGISLALGYLLLTQSDQLAEVGIFLGCGMGLLLWIVGVIILATVLRPKRTPDIFDEHLPQIDNHYPA